MQKTGGASALTAIPPEDRLPRVQIPRGQRFLFFGLTESARALRQQAGE